MPPKLRLTPEELERLPTLLAQVESARSDFPADAPASAQAAWVRERYRLSDGTISDGGRIPSLNLITLLLFEHGVHRSLDQVARDLAILQTAH